MLFRTDLTEEEATHSRWLSEFCELASRPDFIDAVRFWDEPRLTLLSRRMTVVRPAEKLEDFQCLYYGDELQERFAVDFTGHCFADIPELNEIRYSMDAFRQVAIHRTPHVSRISRTQRDPQGIDYTRIIFPVLDGVRTRLVAAIMVFLD